MVRSLLHPLNAARLLIEVGAPEAAVMAAVLHDTVEDTDATLEDIARDFGPEVAALVEGASEPDKSAAWEARKRHTIEHLGTASREQLLVSVADKLDNIRAIRADLDKHGEAVWAKFKRPRAEQAWYYRALAEVFAARTDSGRRRGALPGVRRRGQARLSLGPLLARRMELLFDCYRLNVASQERSVSRSWCAARGCWRAR